MGDDGYIKRIVHRLVAHIPAFRGPCRLIASWHCVPEETDGKRSFHISKTACLFMSPHGSHGHVGLSLCRVCCCVSCFWRMWCARWCRLGNWCAMVNKLLMYHKITVCSYWFFFFSRVVRHSLYSQSVCMQSLKEELEQGILRERGVSNRMCRIIDRCRWLWEMNPIEAICQDRNKEICIGRKSKSLHELCINIVSGWNSLLSA